MKRTWMKVTSPDAAPFWAAIEGDAIVAVVGGVVRPGICDGKPLRADDTLSAWAHIGWTIEGPFDEPK